MDDRLPVPNTAPPHDFRGDPRCWPDHPPGLSDVAQQRRDQIMDAAEAIIANEGIHKLSLGRIEEKIGRMSRGQLTYYFPTKESILLAVHDRMLRRMIVQALSGDGPKPMTGQAWACLQHALATHLKPAALEQSKDLFSLLSTFLAQMGHREDYRTQLSAMYAGWRAHLTADIADSVPEPRPVSPAVAASLFQALIHGLTMQLRVDPNAFDRAEMLAAVTRLLAPIFQPDSVPSHPERANP